MAHNTPGFAESMFTIFPIGCIQSTRNLLSLYYGPLQQIQVPHETEMKQFMSENVPHNHE